MKKEIIHKELSYKLNGILFAVHNELGRYRNEKQYGDLIEWYFQHYGIPYKRELVLPASFSAEKAGRNKVDFIIDDRIILEIKSKRFLEKNDYFQTMRYLQSFGKRLGILANFHQKYLVPKRILSGYRNS
jgi:GxxExxY protein